MTQHSALLLPLLTLVAWSLVMWLWMYATRLPAIIQSGMKLDPNAPSGEQMATLPPRVRWKADNYNHLMEQPVLFYALILALVQLDASHPFALAMAWSYVGLRILHSLIQALVNRIEWRFAVFALGTLPLFGLTGYALSLALLA
ncbi:MAPEG family protein [Ferrimonas balearica]|uniref:MAPEG family protein n=1 Tax=Ferrimonas balearica TaxID=44012 RepID=UPI001C95E697|nr:MAPEG family protein [Ferrimonas balearica]MBY5979177.1 MAPEG family protein [Ferrimonas balearica]